MVKTVLGVSHRGLTEWKFQRLTAIIMGIYSVWLLAYWMCHPGLAYAQWHSLFYAQTVRIATILFLLSMLYHAWIGMWTVFTDYVKCFVIRCVLEVLMFILLAACFFWGVMILWSL